MKELRKNKWREVRYGDYVDHIEKNETDHEKRLQTKYISVEHIETGKLKIGNWSTEIMPTFVRTFKPGQVLFGKRRAYQRKVAIAEFNGICSPHIWALEAKNGLSQKLLPYIMLTDRFYEYVNANSAGTMSVYLKWPQLSAYKFLLPPASQQDQLFSLFQSQEIAIEQLEEQEKKILLLKKKLLKELVDIKPRFGSLLNTTNCKRFFLGEIAECDKKPNQSTEGDGRFIGLDNIAAEDFQLQGWGDTTDGTTFTKRFGKGDILFGKRRAYLKKVAIANFDGVCSGDILVIRAKNNKILQGLLPFYVASDPFIQHAVSTSAGSLSPRTKWKDLAEFEVSIPEFETQEKILDVLRRLEQIKIQLKQQKVVLKSLKQKLLNDILG